MKFLEYKAKEIFARYGIPVPRGVLASTPEEINDPPLPCMVKAQVLIGGRGKAGGIRPAESLDEARAVARQILGMDIHGYRVKQVYLEERLSIAKELYLGLTIDRSAREPLLMATAMGGMEVEDVPRDQLFMEHIPAMVGVQPYVLRSLMTKLGVSKEIGDQVSPIVRKAYELFRKEDAELVEINPLVVTTDGRVIAGDAKLVIDDNAEYRHPEYANLDQDRTPLEQEAHDKGIVFIQLDGDIGVIANGAGLTMATLDVLNLKGGKGGTFLDLGGTDDPEKVKQAFEILIKSRPSVILVNIFGGITKADTVATGVKQALEEMHTKIPVVARIKGVNEAQAKEILRSMGMYAAETIEEAAELAVKVRAGGT
jgi:succinyl-CoA synthetase beta subunit